MDTPLVRGEGLDSGKSIRLLNGGVPKGAPKGSTPLPSAIHK
jgi:hypothetical protein